MIEVEAGRQRTGDVVPDREEEGHTGEEKQGRDGAALIMDAALAAFHRQGFHGTTIRDIAGGASVSVALIYYHFDCKDDILEQIMLRGHRRTRETLHMVLQSCSDSPLERLEAYTRAVVKEHCEWQQEAFVCDRELRSLRPECKAMVIDIRDEMAAIFVKILEDGIREGVFRPMNVWLTTRAILRMYAGVGRWYRAGGPETPEQISEAYVDFGRRMVLADTVSS